MAGDVAALVESQVTVEVPRRLGTPDDTFRDRLQGYVADLTTQLGIPVEPVVTVNELPPDADTCRVWIDGARCGLAGEIDSTADAGDEHLAADVARVVYRNRELFIGESVAARQRGEWEQVDPSLAATLGDDQLATVLRELIRRCARMSAPAVELREGEDAQAIPRELVSEQLCERMLAARPAAKIRVSVGADLAGAVESVPGSPTTRPYSSDVRLSIASGLLQDLLSEELGLVFPSVAFAVDAELGDGTFRIQINDLEYPPFRGLRASEVMVNVTPEGLAEHGVDGRGAKHPTFGTVTSVVEVDDARLSDLNDLGFATWGPEGQISYTLARELRRHAGALLAPSLLTFRLNRLHEAYPATVDAMRHRLDRHRLAAVTRRLLDEQVSIRDLVGVLDGILEVDGSVEIDQSRHRLISPNPGSVWPVSPGAERSTPTADDYADCVRRHLRAQLTGAHSLGGSRLLALDVDSRIEARIRKAATDPLDESEMDQLWEAISAVYQPLALLGAPLVVLTNSEVRRRLRRLLEREFPVLPILSRDEVAPGTRLDHVEQIVWNPK